MVHIRNEIVLIILNFDCNFNSINVLCVLTGSIKSFMNKKKASPFLTLKATMRKTRPEIKSDVSFFYSDQIYF